MESALYAAFLAKDGPLMEIVRTTPLGAELMDAGFSASPDMVRMVATGAADVLTRWLERRDMAPDLGPAKALAEMIVSALMGFKSTARTVFGPAGARGPVGLRDGARFGVGHMTSKPGFPESSR
jgi:hypothetical protein